MRSDPTTGRTTHERRHGHDLRRRAPGGPPFLRYLVVDLAADMVVQAGEPVAVRVEGDEHVEPDELPAGDHLTTVHVEWYETNPVDEPDPARRVTRLAFRLAPYAQLMSAGRQRP
ncbi:MAG: hypothetical protein ACRYG2_35170 [Janthinobacterium lividum]